MNRAIQFVVIASLFFGTVSRLPAPILEPTPSSTPSSAESTKSKKATNKSKANSENSKTDAAIKGKASPFAGTWAGSAKARVLNGDAYDGPVTQYIINISNDEKTAVTAMKSASVANWVSVQSPCVRQGGGLTWNVQGAGKVGTVTYTFTLQLSGGGSAMLRMNSIATDGELRATAEATGTLTKR